MDEPDLRLRVIAAAGVAAMTTALVVWVEHDGAEALPDLIDRAFDMLIHALDD